MATARVTLLDVARLAGVSRTTASFVMSGRHDMRISRDAEQRVLRAARELNYRPNLLARGLRTNLSQTIGMLSDVIATAAFAGEIVRGSLTTALQRDHLLFIGESGCDPALEERLLQSMLDHGVSGFVYATESTRRARIPGTLRGYPLVLLNCVGMKSDTTVVPDELEAGRSAAQALLEAGHGERIYLVGEVTPETIAATERLAGIEEVLAAASTGLTGRIDTTWWPDSARAAIDHFLASGNRPAAFICLNDRIALGVYQALSAHYLRIPADVSVVSFDDSDLASWLSPGLTSVALPYFDLGRRAVELLLDPGRAAGSHRIPMPLRTRQSIAAPA